MASDPGKEFMATHDQGAQATSDDAQMSGDDALSQARFELSSEESPREKSEGTGEEGGEEEGKEEDRSVTVYGSESSPKSGEIEVDTNKVIVDSSNLEATPHGVDPEVVRDHAGLEHVSNLEILRAADLPPRWLNRRRLWIIGSVVLVFLIAAVLAIGLVIGLVVSRRPSTPDSSTTSTLANNSCGTFPKPIHRQLLAAAAVESNLHIFARGVDNDIWFRSLAGANSTWLSSWSPLTPGAGEVFSGPPTAIAWAPHGAPRLNIFAPRQNGFNVLSAGYSNGSWATTWQNLGESTASPIMLCRVPEGFVSSGAGSPERIDQWVVNRESRSIMHDFWNSAIGNGTGDFQEPATYTEWEGSPTVQASASGLGVMCRKDDPIHSLLMYANGSDSVRFRHYTGADRVWNPWVDLGGSFIGDPVVLPFNGMQFSFFGIMSSGAMQTFNWTNVTGVGYRPPMTLLGGNFTSMPSAVVTNAAPLRLDVVARGLDGHIQHKAFHDGQWESDWEDLGVTGASAPLLFKYEVVTGQGSRNQTMLATIGDDKQLYFATWDSSSTKAWKDLMGPWAGAGGNLTMNSMCD